MEVPSSSHAMQVGLFVLALYALCIIWPFMYPYSADVQTFHLLSLQLTFPGFTGFTLLSIVWGGILSFVYGFIGSMLFHSFHKGCCRK